MHRVRSHKDKPGGRNESQRGAAHCAAAARRATGATAPREEQELYEEEPDFRRLAGGRAPPVATAIFALSSVIRAYPARSSFPRVPADCISQAVTSWSLHPIRCIDIAIDISEPDAVKSVRT